MKPSRLLYVFLALAFVVTGCKKEPTQTAKELSQAGTPEELRQAVRDGNIEQVRSLISGGADVSRKTWPGWNPLHDAAACGHKDVAELLIVKGAGINAKDNHGRTPLSLAQDKGYTEIVELLRKHGAKEDNDTSRPTDTPHDTRQEDKAAGP